MRTGKRLGAIVIAVVLMAAGVFVVGEVLHQAGSTGEVGTRAPAPPAEAVLARQAGQFWTLGDPPRSRPAPSPGAGSGRTLAVAAQRRAYPGAPPSIPHPVAAELATGELCLGCHEHGGWTPRFEAYAPVTPHPGLLACQQCHVPTHDVALFVESDSVRPAPPAIDRQAMPGAPPPIPHRLRMRESCNACHAGPAAPEEIRTDHPERVGCLQCHVAQQVDGSWTRSGDESSIAGGMP